MKLGSHATANTGATAYLVGYAKPSTGDPASDKPPITLIIFSRAGRRNRRIIRVIFHWATQSGLTRLIT